MFIKNRNTIKNRYSLDITRKNGIIYLYKYKYKIKKLEREGKQSRENIGKHTLYFRKT